ncbi:hypothetical protein BJF77_01175 [Kocuria sp. CNJ-770]|uniref:hypothetical protein n=1 Tax=Kocuria sp. CNJ-770 TaxID=1904964 RepID=UPI00095C2B75|nr:hypothetical protein [Kocuria sp. CNJ-770]OLT09121.1 hypothetical protein BJF77_01175 [Kocuria sp. CNJ-770]
MREHLARRAADELQRGLGRRTFFRAAAGVAAAGADELQRGLGRVPTISTPVLQTGTSVEFFGRVGPLRFPYVTIVSAQEPGRKLALRTTRGIVDLLAVTTWAAVDGGTEVRTTVDGRLTAARAGLAAWAERIVRRNLGAELGDLKRLLETGQFEFTVPSQLTAHPPRCTLETPPDFF